MSFTRLISSVLAIPVTLVVIFFSGWILAAGCSRAHILVRNESGTTLSNLGVSGASKQRRADTLAAPSEWITVTPYRRGDLIQLSFVSADKSYVTTAEMDTNHSGICGITFTVDSNRVVKSGLKY